MPGGAGNDSIVNTNPGETIDGGDGVDKVTVDRRSATTPVKLSFDNHGTYSPSWLTGFSDGTTITNVETIAVIGGSSDDQVYFWNPAYNTAWGANTFDGGAGTHDRAIVSIDPSSTGIQFQVVNGSYVITDRASGNPLLQLTNVEYVDLRGSLGDDVFTGTDDPNSGLIPGTLWLDGAEGNDTFYGCYSLRPTYESAPSGVTINLGTNAPQAVGAGRGIDTLINVSNLFGSHYADTITGSARNDSIWSDLGDDVVHGGDGSDSIFGSDGNDTITGDAGADDLHGDAGNDTLFGNDDGDELTGGAGNDTLDGGSNVDTAIVAGNRAAYTITQTSTGNFTVTGTDGTDTLTNIEYLRFDDQTMKLLPGTGTTVDFNLAASTYMAAIRDFDGHDLGSASSWSSIGTADVNGDGSVEHILVNRAIGRWAEVATAPDGKVYFDDHGWAGGTRVVGIYIDPLVTQGIVQAGSATDSQRRFQNDLQIDNIRGILGQGDYDHNGLQEIYFSLTDGTAYLHAYMHADGNIQYANYQNKQQVIDYLTTNGVAPSTWSTWFPASQVAMETVSTVASTGGLNPNAGAALPTFAAVAG